MAGLTHVTLITQVSPGSRGGFIACIKLNPPSLFWTDFLLFTSFLRESTPINRDLKRAAERSMSSHIQIFPGLLQALVSVVPNCFQRQFSLDQKRWTD